MKLLIISLFALLALGLQGCFTLRIVGENVQSPLLPDRVDSVHSAFMTPDSAVTINFAVAPRNKRKAEAHHLSFSLADFSDAVLEYPSYYGLTLSDSARIRGLDYLSLQYQGADSGLVATVSRNLLKKGYVSAPVLGIEFDQSQICTDSVLVEYAPPDETISLTVMLMPPLQKDTAQFTFVGVYLPATTRRRVWPYFLLPVSVALDLATSPIQMIGFLLIVSALEKG